MRLKFHSVAERFFARVDKTGPLILETRCWIWTGYLDRSGYGRFKVQHRMDQAHRVAWNLAHGEIPPGMLVIHRCDNPPCVLVSHLRLGTNADNSQDKISKNRHAKGSRCGAAKLTEEDIPKIRARLAAGISQVQVGKEFGVSTSAIRWIHHGPNWAWVKDH